MNNTSAKTLQLTGHKPGRPRIGELRLVSPKAAALQEWREKNREHYRAYQRNKQAEWRAANHERSNEIGRNSQRRRREALKKTLILIETK